ncbi:MAG: AraC family transcriptional regulator [Alphaproteobacteria bacterium]|nr:AraC family transcriptional regulator [Alphaproteobacteria bacterium]
MVGNSIRSGVQGLERSCSHGRDDWFRCTPPVGGIELLEAHFRDPAFAKHRHDTYAIGLTEIGVQVFDYRGTTEASTPGRVVVLHPDEAHDGRAGTEIGFGYRNVYVDPSRIFDAVYAITGEYRPLPFVRTAVMTSRTLAAAVRAVFAFELQPLVIDDLIVRFAEGLLENESPRGRFKRNHTFDIAAIRRARDFLDTERTRVVRSNELEAVTGLRRYDLARQFRTSMGTSPYRYGLLRRLELARDRLRTRQSLADVAAETGFADQAHFTRILKSTIGLTPGQYQSMIRE